MARWARVVAFLAFLSAAIILFSVYLGQDPDWWNWADLWGLHHESLFAGSLAVGFAALYFAWKGY